MKTLPLATRYNILRYQLERPWLSEYQCAQLIILYDNGKLLQALQLLLAVDAQYQLSLN